MTRTSSQPPDATLTGTYDGTYSATIVPCGTGAPVKYSGTTTVYLVQVGSSLSGGIVIFGDKRDRNENGVCTLIDAGTVAFPFTGQVNGSAITLTFFVENGKTIDFTGAVSGNTITGSGPGEFPGESVSFTVTRTTTVTPPPAIVGFTATPSSITAGGSSTLAWSTVNAASVAIDNGVGAQPVAGVATVAPRTSTTYTLTAKGPGGSSTATATVTVTGIGPRVVAASFPVGMIQASGESGATDSFFVANVGTDPTTVTATPSGGFFTIAPSSFTLQPGTSQSITITANSQPAGSYDGTIALSGNGVQQGGITVRVRLLVATAPTGSVNPRAAVPRVDLSAPAGQNPSGSVSITNSGSSTVQGIATADVPWIIPQSGLITINAGETKSITFTIDRTKRPDSAALFGGASGTITLRFLGAAPPPNARLAADTSPTSGISISIVDVVTPTVTSGTPPPLSTSELALFVAGHGSVPGIAGDLFLSNRGTSAIPDLKLFLTAASQIATLPQLAANFGVTLPSVSTSIFGQESGSGLMLRGSSLDSLAAAAMRMVNPAGSDAYFSSIPVFRSDRGVGPGGRLVLSGVERTGNSGTAVLVQELSGLAGSADIQGYDSNGAPIGAKMSITMTPFVSRNDAATTIVEGARSVVITNTGSGSSRINAYARVSDNSTSDAWIVIDPAVTYGSSAGDFVMPLISTPTGGGKTDIFLTNGATASATTTMNVVSASNRRRAVRGTHLFQENESSQQFTMGSLETRQTTVTPTNGYVRFSGASAVSASGRVTVTNGGKTFGSALPVLPVSAAMSSGQSKRFAGVSDASVRTIGAGTPATFRSSILLLETAGQPATVRVSLWYTFPAGVLVSAQTVSSKEFTVGANQILVIRDLSRTVIGAQRDSFGDLRDMQVDVEVIGGSGRVLPFIESVENGTGDLVMRAE
ncbi:MAG: Ig-like domain-containing protein [Thermoanaerobaculia bacterium]